MLVFRSQILLISCMDIQNYQNGYLIVLFYGLLSPAEVQSLECLYRPADSPEPISPQRIPSDFHVCQSQWPRGLRRRSATARLLRSWVRIPPGAWMSVCCECCVLSGRGLCDGLITRPEESYRLWCVVVCDLETSWMRRPWPNWGLSRQKQTYVPNWVLANRTDKSIVHTECSSSENTCWSHIWCTYSEAGTCTKLPESI